MEINKTENGHYIIIATKLELTVICDSIGSRTPSRGVSWVKERYNLDVPNEMWAETYFTITDMLREKS